MLFILYSIHCQNSLKIQILLISLKIYVEVSELGDNNVYHQTYCLSPDPLSVTRTNVCHQNHCLSPEPLSVTSATVCHQTHCLSPEPLSFTRPKVCHKTNCLSPDVLSATRPTVSQQTRSMPSDGSNKIEHVPISLGNTRVHWELQIPKFNFSPPP